MLQRLAPDAEVDVGHPADPGDVLPRGRTLGEYDGVTWTGSSLTIYAPGDDRVRRQVELARAVFAAGVPSFGSCWAAQLAAAAAGGRCAPNPRGREFGVARRIALSSEGRAHRLYAGRPPVFEALSSHADEVAELPPGAELLASNEWSRVQALVVGEGEGAFWAVQYHPEYDLHEVAALCRMRMDELVKQGTFEDHAAATAYVEQLEALHADPSRADLADRLGLDDQVLDEGERTREVRNWIEHLTLNPGSRPILPGRSGRT